MKITPVVPVIPIPRTRVVKARTDNERIQKLSEEQVDKKRMFSDLLKDYNSSIANK